MKNEKIQQQFNLEKVQAVTDKLQSIEELKSTPISVSLNENGIVALNGTISRVEHHGLATRVAKEIPGIFYVENNLRVVTGQPRLSY